MAVYMISDGQGRVKIGCAANAAQRLRNLQHANPNRLEIIRTLKYAGYAVERWLHRRYTKQRIVGEWFTFVPDMLKVIPPDEPIATAIDRPDDELLNEYDEALWLRVSVQWLRLGREIGYGPPFERRGRIIRYQRGKTRAWLNETKEIRESGRVNAPGD